MEGAKVRIAPPVVARHTAQELLAIRTPDALYYPLTLPFGPASGPAQFQMRVSEILGDLEGHGVASYIGDLGLYGTTFEEYLQRLQTMLERLDAYQPGT